MTAPGHKSAIVVGAGVGGLAAAILLARAGVGVRVYERAAKVGGKLREIDVGGRRFDAGPSVFTMRWVFEELFDQHLDDYVRLLPLEPLCRHFFSDGSVLDLFTDEERSCRAIERFAGAASARGYLAYRRHAAKIFEIVRGPFMEQAIPPLLSFMNPRSLVQLTQIDGMRTLWKALEEFFPDERLRQLFGRYATYNGSSPFHAPATLAVIAHVENAHGVFACAGGIYRLAEALERRAREVGVEIVTGADVCEVVVEAGRAVGVRVGSERAVERADLVIANCDVAHLYGRLLEAAPAARKLAVRHAAERLSLSAYLLLAVATRAPGDRLAHHNVFFSADYRREFAELLDGNAPADPTVYLCAQDRTDEQAAAAGTEGAAPGETERCFFLTNAPPLDRSRVDWKSETGRCRERVARALARHGWQLESEAEESITPLDFAERFPSSRGAIYGLSSNSAMAAFKRPTNRVPGIAGLYAAGGTAHPGAGLPMVVLSARIATKLALDDLGGGAATRARS